MIIFRVVSVPGMIKGIYEDYFVIQTIDSIRLWFSLRVLIVAVLVIIYFTTFVQQAEYKIPIQYTKIAQVHLQVPTYR